MNTDDVRTDYQEETRRVSRDQAIGIAARIIANDRQDTPHDLAVAIVDALTRHWLIRG